MNYRYCAFFLLFISFFARAVRGLGYKPSPSSAAPLLQSMSCPSDSLCFSECDKSKYIFNLSTKVTFYKKKKSIFAWLKDDKYKNFGKIPIYHYMGGERLFKEIGIVQKIDHTILEDISLGKAIYCVLNPMDARLEQKYAIVFYHSNKDPEFLRKYSLDSIIGKGAVNEIIGEVENQLELYLLKKLYDQSGESFKKNYLEI